MSISAHIKIDIVDPKTFLHGLNKIRYICQVHHTQEGVIGQFKRDEMLKRFKDITGFLDYLYQKTNLDIADGTSEKLIKFCHMLLNFSRKDADKILTYLEKNNETTVRIIHTLIKLYLRNDTVSIDALRMLSKRDYIRKKNIDWLVNVDRENFIRTLKDDIRILSKMDTHDIMTLMHLFPELERSDILIRQIVHSNGSNILHFKCQRSSDINDIINCIKIIPCQIKYYDDNHPFQWLLKDNGKFRFSYNEIMTFIDLLTYASDNLLLYDNDNDIDLEIDYLKLHCDSTIDDLYEVIINTINEKQEHISRSKQIKFKNDFQKFINKMLK